MPWRLEQAADFIDGLEANGGTNMAPALDLAMGLPEARARGTLRFSLSAMTTAAEMRFQSASQQATEARARALETEAERTERDAQLLVVHHHQRVARLLAVLGGGLLLLLRRRSTRGGK